MTTLAHLNTCDTAAFVDRLRGIHEHSPWIPEREAEQLSLLRAHPELAG